MASLFKGYRILTWPRFIMCVHISVRNLNKLGLSDMFGKEKKMLLDL